MEMEDNKRLAAKHIITLQIRYNGRLYSKEAFGTNNGRQKKSS
jgi:hypothetical protein